MDAFYELMHKYYKQFGEIFPCAMLKGVSEERLIEIMKDCMERNEPYQDILGAIY